MPYPTMDIDAIPTAGKTHAYKPLLVAEVDLYRWLVDSGGVLTGKLKGTLIRPDNSTVAKVYTIIVVPVMTVDPALLTGGTSSIAITIVGTANAREVRTETVTATGGTRTLTFGGQTTSALAFNATAATIQTALDALSNVAPGDIVVTGTGPYVYTFNQEYDTTAVQVNLLNTEPKYVKVLLTPGDLAAAGTYGFVAEFKQADGWLVAPRVSFIVSA